jgi:methylenetetrahydrofolate dehydrogenase (NADP+) / methenyltetrahydrofolate cyclohydrolase
MESEGIMTSSHSHSFVSSPSALFNAAVLRLDGQTCANRVLQQLQERITAALPVRSRPPRLAVIQVGDNPASTIYVNKKHEMAQRIGMQSDIYRLAEDTPEADLLLKLDALNNDDTVDGILVQLPLPAHMNAQLVLERIAPEKDVDGFHPLNVGRLYSGLPPHALPCTPAGMMTLLKHYQISVAGKHAVVLGRSNIVGKPMAQLLLQADATVTLCHSRSLDVERFLKTADIVVVAVGKPHVLQGKDIKEGCVVLDVGINRDAETGKLIGDADYDSVAAVASAVTPVPGGVGPMTIATLLENTYRLYCLKQNS